jgi:hypothetical protein
MRPMIVDAGAAHALEQIETRAADVQHAYTPGASPAFDDVLATTDLSRADLDPLCVAPPPGTYFVSSDDRGRTLYTRDGALGLRDVTIVGTNGQPMLGYTAHQSTLRALRIDAVDTALGRVRNLRVEADGSVAYDRASIDPRSGGVEYERVLVGRLALARFPAATRSSPVDATHVHAPPGVVPHFGEPGDGNFETLQPMARAMSRIDLDASLEKLDDAYIELDAIIAAQRAQFSSTKTAMDVVK